MVGYTLVPPNMMANFSHFPVVDAFDCAHKRGDGQGIIAVRATKNANGRLVTIAFHDALGSESTLVCDAMARAEAKCFQASPSAINDTSAEDDSDVTRVSPCMPRLPTPLPAHRHESQCRLTIGAPHTGSTRHTAWPFKTGVRARPLPRRSGTLGPTCSDASSTTRRSSSGTAKQEHRTAAYTRRRCVGPSATSTRWTWP